jgi:sulfur carrier protein
MEIQLNGKQTEVAGGITLTQLLKNLKLQAAQVAIQVNDDIIPRDRYGSVVLNGGDRVELVTFTSGG